MLKYISLKNRIKIYFFFLIQHSALILQFLNYITIDGF